ncbi:sulfite reductase [NADPH] flavoprotein alpha-component [Shewanella sp. NFH-SH190041]|uniref:diflavin oxidoreductase n=1 Tax=Shewanella sp. NFH-SH190041 TaxID=2950245 RepID=UPI0021C37765|nr:flavodoxin domain-containing protein [Shewanella sp. NFH-SH190041]BDM65558.1 sulfite reductase [NADPH] flavoprotein alpha-component [Shewanella sp. NFH-SH190041]
MAFNVSSPFPHLLSEKQQLLLSQLTADMSSQQLTWLSGYLAGQASVATTAAGTSTTESPAVTSSPILTVLYGSQTGNGQALAEQLAEEAKQAGWQVSLSAMGDFQPRRLKQVAFLAVVVSTHGEGDPPDDALALHQFLHSSRAGQLPDLQYAVLALGDSSYEYFCQTGREFDQQLSALGAQPLLPLQECDVDYSALAADWRRSLLARLQTLQPNDVVGEGAGLGGELGVAALPQAAAMTVNKDRPIIAKVLVNQPITGRDAGRAIHHLELALPDEQLQYHPGDALGVWFHNSHELVGEILAGLSLAAETPVQVAPLHQGVLHTATITADMPSEPDSIAKGNLAPDNDNGQVETISLEQALLTRRELTQVSAGLLQQWAELQSDNTLSTLLDEVDSIREFACEFQLADLLRCWPITISAQQLVDMLPPLTPRLYSIASAQDDVGDEVHLTVALKTDLHADIPRFGGASGFLSRMDAGTELLVYLVANRYFRLPPSPDTAVIMIGPGTGVAPFRAFMQQRDVRGDTGKNWLFFGNRYFEQDFLYQTEWQQHLKSGLLTRLDVAFSRDGPSRRYVQHCIAEQGELLWQWLEQGAHLYICGDGSNMAKDVHRALLDVVAEYGGLDEAGAAEYLNQLRQQQRYQKDVY